MMDGWMGNRWVNEQMGGWVNGWIIDRWVNEQIDG